MLRQIIKNIVDSLIVFECRFVEREAHVKKRVLIFRKDVLGDFIIFLPTLEYYREYYKNYGISLVVSSMSVGFAPLFPFIDDVIIFDQKKFRTNFWYRRAFIKSLVHKGFDVAIYPVYSSEKIGDIIMKATGAPKIIDFKTIDVPENLNELDRNMAFVSGVVGKACTPSSPTIDVTLLDQSKFERIARESNLVQKKYVVMVPGAGAKYRMWQFNKMSEVADYFIEKGLIVVLAGGVDEKWISSEIINRSRCKNKIVDLIGKTDLPTLAHLLANAKLYFGNETGTLHFAISVGAPVVAITGGGHLGRFFPYGNLEMNRIVFDPEMKCRGDGWKCAEGLPEGEPAPCIKNITVESAIKEIDSLLAIIG